MKSGKIALSTIIVFAVLTVFAVSTVSAAPPANAVYFIPQHSTISAGPSNNITVELRINTTDAINSWQADVSFSPACVNITNVTFAWTIGAPWAHHDNHVTIGDAKATPCVAGDMLLATLTIYCEAWDCTSPLNFSGIDNATRLISCAGTNLATTWQNGTVTNEAPPKFDTGPGSYPSIMGIHRGNFTPHRNVTVRQMYTYPCAGTGGHSEFVRIYGNSIDINGTWNGYHGDYHNITFPHQFTLLANHTYNYTIKTGSYPQIHHNRTLTVLDGEITCTKFTDANDEVYYDWIPAIRLFL